MFYVLTSCTLLGKFGILSGMVANSFDQHSAITSCLITPLSFLSGTFYSTQFLPETFAKIAHFNPFFYLIDGFRYGFIGAHDGNLKIGMLILILLMLMLWLLCVKLFSSGYKLRS